ncbi:DUF192 domain-containing protein [bacterium]|nr:DUF192 domain-containing protein [bacterium]
MNRQNDHQEFELRVQSARSLLSRLTGLLGTVSPPEGHGLHIVHCSSIHTFGMKYPIDVLFLDREQRIVRICREVGPNRTCKAPAGARSVVELAPGTANRFSNGDILKLHDEGSHKPGAHVLRNLFHWPINVMIGLVWFKFVLAVALHAVTHPHAMNIGILIHNTLLMLLFFSRRKSSRTSFRILDWVIPVLTLMFTMFLRPAAGSPENWVQWSFMMQAAGLAGIIASLMSLGRSFGIVPANRRIVSHGTYRIVRHPLYLSEIVFHAGFFLGNISAFNGALIVLILAGQLWRSLSEEKLLTADSAYRAYKARVRYRFLPGLF